MDGRRQRELLKRLNIEPDWAASATDPGAQIGDEEWRQVEAAAEGLPVQNSTED